MDRLKWKIENWKNAYLTIDKKGVACALSMLVITMGIYMHVAQNMIRQYVRVQAYSFLIVAVFLSLIQVVDIKISDNTRRVYGYFLLLVAPGVSFYSMEYMNDNKISEMHFLNATLNYIIYLMVYLILYILSNRLTFTIIAGNLFMFAYIVINSWVYQYRGSPIKAFDILAIGTALSVAEGYEFKLNYRATLIMIYMFVVILLALKIKWYQKRIRKRISRSVLLVLFLVCICKSCFSKEFISEKKLSPDGWAIHESVLEHGMLLDLVAGIPYLEVEKPEGYTVKEAANIEKNGASANQFEVPEVANPDIIAIMNESFSDLRVLGNLEVSQEYLANFYGLQENVVRGNVYVPIRGGLTSNSEFEFMTGYTCAFLPSSSIAFQTVIKSGTENLGKKLADEGYSTTFMHPFLAEGWNRNGVYKNFGFDNILFLEDMERDLNEEVDFVRGFVSDSANFRKVIEEYEKRKNENDKNSTFLFDVTMQNHGGYGAGVNELEILYPQINDMEAVEYLSLIKRSDEAFQELINYYSLIETPTVILMFGDHQPALQEFTDALQAGTTEEDIAGKMEEYCVPFVIWANYDIEEKFYDGISANFLQTILMETAGQPMSDYQKYLGNLMEQYPVITGRGVKDAEGNWYKFDEAKNFEAIEQYSKVQYWNLIDQRKK